MKNLMKVFAFSCLFLALSSFVNFGVIVVEIVGEKNNQTYCTITIPGKYFNEAGSLICPIEVEITACGKMPISFTSNEPIIYLPQLACDEPIIKISIADFSASRKIKL